MKITRRRFMAGMTALLSMAGLSYCSSSLIRELSNRRRPNIILFVADDMRFDAVGYAGNDIVKTPNLDALAKDSVVFTNSFVTTSICPTSRASIYTGQYALKHRVYGFARAIARASYNKLFFLHLRKAGYHTGFVGKWGIGGPLPKELFHHWKGFPGQGHYFAPRRKRHLTDIHTKKTIDFLRKLPDNKPFALIVAYKAPHAPIKPHTRFRKIYEDVEIPLNRLDTLEVINSLPPMLRERALSKTRNADELAKKRELIKGYYGLISGLDNYIGQILSFLKEHKLYNDTTIMFTSDNGMMHGSHGIWGKWYMFEESIRVPLLIHPAKNHFSDIESQQVDALALNIDISPTILSMTSGSVPDGIHGRSLLPVMRTPSVKLREGFFYEFSGLIRLYRCIGYRTSIWKFSRYTNLEDRSQQEECLYNIADDPDELHNLADNPQYYSVLEELREKTFQEKDRLRST